MRKTFRILIADDDGKWAKFIAQRLRKIVNVVVDISTSVSDAIEKIKECFYDIVFCDYRMQYTDSRSVSHYEGGYLISAEAKSHLPQVNTVMVTAYGSSDLARETLIREKFNDYIEKDVNPEKDRQKIEAYVTDFINNWDKRPVSTNPFRTQRGQTPSYMVPRYINGKTDLEFMAEQLQVAEQGSQARFLVLGRVGSGKSCLLNHFKNYSQKRGHMLSYYDILPRINERTLEEEISELISGIIRGFRKIQVLDLKKVLDYLKSMGVNVEGFGFKIELQKEKRKLLPDAILRNFLKSILDDLQNKSEATGILIDNISTDHPLPPSIGYLLHTLSEEDFVNRPVVIGLSLATKEPSNRMGYTIDPEISRFFAGKIIQMPNFTKDQVHELAFQTLADTGVTIEPALIEKVFEYSNGHPFICQLLFYYSYDHQIGGKVTNEAFADVLRNCRLELPSFFRNFFGEVNQNEEVMLELIAEGSDGLDVKEIQSILLNTNKADLITSAENYCKNLSDRDILKRKARGKYKINFSN